MDMLPVEQRFAGTRIFCAFRRPLAQEQATIVTIPGGPCLSADYLKPFLARLSETTGLNVGLLNLPNHDRSHGPQSGTLTYPECLELIGIAVRGIADQCGKLILFGQSFGARLALDLLTKPELKVRGAILAGLPSRFEISRVLEARLAAEKLEDYTGTSADEGVFARNWRRILPHYTAVKIAAEDFERLAAGTRWAGNERMLENAPPIEQILPAVMKRSGATRLLALQGSADIVVPDGNADSLTRAIPTMRFQEISGAGHFVMIEKPEATLEVMSAFLAQGDAA